MRLVKNASKAWTWFSVQAMTLAVAVQGAWYGMPADMQERIPEWGVDLVAVAILVLGIFGRLVDQGAEDD
jgi:hypothetical protein